MQYTENYSLKLPGYGDNADVGDLNDNTTAIDALIHANRQIEAPAFSTETAYTAGDMCVYENVLYKFTADKAAGNWDSTKVTATNLADEVTDAAQSGGTEVEANPVEAATADLHKLKVDTTVYGIPDPTVTKTATGNPIEFGDGADAPLVKCVTEIQGSQDLHGYDKPWVGGAGKNKIPMTVSGIKTINTDGSWSGNAYTINGVTFTIETDGDDNVTGIKANGLASDTANLYIASNFGLNQSAIMSGCPADGSILKYVINWQGNNNDTGNGVVVTNPTPGNVRIQIITTTETVNITFYPMIRLATVADSTFAPYSNICPITAYTEGEIEVRGKNLCLKTVRGYINNASTQVKVDGDSESALFFANLGETYILSSSVGPAVMNRNLIGKVETTEIVNNTPISNIETVQPTNIWTATFTGWALWYKCSALSTDFENSVQIEKGTQATTYEPYTSTTHTTTFPSAIYRGSEDVVNGEVTTARIVGDKSDLNGSISGTSAGGLQFIDSTIPFDEDLICNMLPTIPTRSTAWQGTTECISQNNNGKVRIYANVTDYSDFATKFADLQFVYPYVATSSVTPTNLPIKSLSGYNHIESSTGEMEVEYITDTYQPLVDLIDDAATMEVYSTDEQEIGVWIDGSKLYKKTFTFTISQSGETITVADVSYIDQLVEMSGVLGNATMVPQVSRGSATAQTWANISSGNLIVLVGTSGDEKMGASHITLKYTKTSSNNRSLSKGATDSLRADLSEEKNESEESVDKVDKVDEPTETIEEKEENER